MTAESLSQVHKDMTVTTKVQEARKKQFDFLESMKLHEEVCTDELPGGTHVYVWTLGGHDENTDGVEGQVHSLKLRGTSW